MYPVIPIGSVYIPTYFLVISISCSLGILWAYYRANKLMPEYVDIALNLSLVIMVSGFIGGRLLHIVYEHPHYYMSNPSHIFQFWRGGFVYFGGFFAAVIASFVYLKKMNQSFLKWADVLAPVLLLVYGLGRIANLTSGSGFGTPTDLPWGIIYPPGVEAPAGVPLHPTAIYSLVLSLIGIAILLIQERKKELWVGGLFFLFLAIQGISRIITEFFRGDYRGDLIFGMSVSTLISWVLVLGCSFVFLQKRHQQQ